MRVKDKLRARVEEWEEEFVQNVLQTQNPPNIDEIDIKYEDPDFPFHKSTSNSEEKSQLDIDLDTVPNIPHVDCTSVKIELNDLNEFCLDLRQCEWDCEECQRCMRILSEHVRATHARFQPLHVPLLLDPFLKIKPDPPFYHVSPLIQIKSEFVGHDKNSASDCEDNSEPKTKSRIQHMDHSSVQALEKDPKEFNLDLLQCEHDCETCQKYLSKFSEHVGVHAPPQSIQDPLLIDPTDIDCTRINSGEKQFTCKFCGESCANNKCMDDHEITHIRGISGGRARKVNNYRVIERCHTREKTFKCDVCWKSFSLVGNLKIHKMVHTGERPYECDECGMSFLKKSTLTLHKTIHTGEKPFKCEICEEAFRIPYHLIRHKRIHDGEKPFKCDVCEESFQLMRALKTHKMVHTGGKPHKCDECEKSFWYKTRFTLHMRVHTGEKPNKCDKCQMSFRRSDSLSKHKRKIHPVDKPFKCEECRKSFSSHSILRFHSLVHVHKRSTININHQQKRIHTGEKTFKCDVCMKCFSRQDSLKRHNKIHTSTK